MTTYDYSLSNSSGGNDNVQLPSIEQERGKGQRTTTLCRTGVGECQRTTCLSNRSWGNVDVQLVYRTGVGEMSTYNYSLSNRSGRNVNVQLVSIEQEWGKCQRATSLSNRSWGNVNIQLLSIE